MHLSSSSDLKASNVKSDLVDFKNNLNDMKSSLSNYGLPDSIKKLRSSLENLVSLLQDIGYNLRHNSAISLSLNVGTILFTVDDSKQLVKKATNNYNF